MLVVSRKLGALSICFVVACQGSGDDAPGILGALGEPLPSLSDEQRESFERGRELSLRRFTPEEGLGPEFNATFCGGCHEKPVPGGGAGHYRDFPLVGRPLLSGRVAPRGKNGVQRQFSLETGRDPSDPLTTVTATRNPIPFFGAGLLLEVSDEEILSRADPEDADGDGISGRANIVDGFVGRFGRKAQTADLEIFIRGPLFNHLGITTNPLSEEARARLPITRGSLDAPVPKQSVIPEEATFDQDAAPDPELSEAELFDLVSFSMVLAAPRPSPRDARAERGSELFDELGCAACHVRALEGPRGPVPAYSDLLLHDMGPDLADGFTMGDASGSEFRTQPLWGIVAVAPYLHDGRAGTLDEAIRWHGGEARSAAEAYANLDDGARQEVLAFLASLGGAEQTSDGLLPPAASIPETGTYGGPVRDLDEEERRRFVAGRALFDRDMSYSEGVGPAFNGDSCRGCHFLPTIGGAGPSGVDAMRQGIVSVDGAFRAPGAGTAILRHASFIAPERPEPDPEATVFEPRQTPALFGLGEIERIPNEAIEARADPDDTDGDGISGRAHVLGDGRLGRFGWKANVPSVREFVRDALTNELGLTLPEQAGATFGSTSDADPIADPEVDIETIDAIATFLVFLAPPPRARREPVLEDAGESLFEDIGCARCHVPSFETDGGHALGLYSDLLLHDLAEEGAFGIVEGAATMGEFRTPPLWGLSQTAPYMHDGRASTVEGAIAAHRGEGDESREAFLSLSDEERVALIAFLRSL